MYNAEMLSISNQLAGYGIDRRTNILFLDVGSSNNAGDGDLIGVAFDKATQNARLLSEVISEKKVSTKP